MKTFRQATRLEGPRQTVEKTSLTRPAQLSLAPLGTCWSVEQDDPKITSREGREQAELGVGAGVENRGLDRSAWRGRASWVAACMVGQLEGVGSLQTGYPEGEAAVEGGEMVHVDAVETEETVVASGEANKGGTLTGACRGPVTAKTVLANMVRPVQYYRRNITRTHN